MRYQAVISFEHDTQPVRTTRTEIVAKGLLTAASRAIKMARGEHPGIRWRSVVVVLEKLDDLPQEAE